MFLCLTPKESAKSVPLHPKAIRKSPPYRNTVRGYYGLRPTLLYFVLVSTRTQSDETRQKIPILL